MGHNIFQKSMEDKEEHVTNFKNPSMFGEEVLINATCDILYIPQLNEIFKTFLAAECREISQRLKNLTLNSSSELQEVHKIEMIK